MGDQELNMSVPLDCDGFLRRECPTCEREFKWLPSTGEEATPESVGRYFCPYCQVQAPADAWHTKAQVELATNRVMTDIVGPELDRFARDLKRSSRRTSGLIHFDATYEKPRPMDPLLEPDDMRRVEFECHPSEPVKVLDDWSGPVHCLVCSTQSGGV